MTMQTVAYRRGYLHYTTSGNTTTVRAQNECNESREFSSERSAKEWLRRYNGHKNWNYWNVSLWINNDESLYNLVRNYVMDARHRGGYTKHDVAGAIYRHFISDGYTKTPDGAPYSIGAIRAAMEGM